MTTSGASAFQGADIPSYDVITNCMHCGLCLPTCPTYVLTGLEKSSPRGRIRLIKAVADGNLPITRGFIDEMNFCLDCQACETACPAGVKYGSLVEASRAQIFELGYDSFLSRVAKKIFMNWFFSRQTRLKLLARLIRVYVRSGLHWLIQHSKILNVISAKLHQIGYLLPSISSTFSSDVIQKTVQAPGKPRFRVGFLTGCIMDVSFADVNLDTIALLVKQGCEVVIPKEQGCCGSLQAHNGDLSTARRFARETVKAFGGENLDYVVLNSAGCGAFMKEYGHLLGGDKEFGTSSKELSAKVKDITEFLAETGFEGSSSRHDFFGKRVTYHDACHLVHTQKVSSQPRTLLQSIPDIQYVELPEASWCCGSAGVYNIVRYDDSMKLLDRKIDNINSVHPDVLVTGNPGCLVQLQYGLARRGIKVELLHTATFLRRVCET